MPELHFKNGYSYAWILMITMSLIMLFIVRRLHKAHIHV